MRMIVFAVAFCLTARPISNAADPDKTSQSGPRPLAEILFRYASDLSHALHERPLEDRSQSDYLRATDAFSQVIRLDTDTYYSAESSVRVAELYRERADATGDSALYQQAIEMFRKVIAEHPQSAFVGDALISIAQISEESLQDLDGAAAAYRELIHYFPASVMAREARAVLARFEAQLNARPIDVLVSSNTGTIAGRGYEAFGQPKLTNVRNFTGPDYARVVIDLSDEAHYIESASNNRLQINVAKAAVSPSLFGRRFIVGNSSLLKRIIVSEADGTDSNKGVKVEIELSSLSDYSTFHLSNPARIVVDLHAAGTVAKPRYAPARGHADSVAVEDSEVERGEANSGRREPMDLTASARRSWADKRLPEITDPILPFSPNESSNSTQKSPAEGEALAAAVDAKVAESGIKCIVIDPGHGGHDTGTISGSGLKEKDLVLDVARRLKGYIKRNYPGIEVVMTRDSDRFIALEERTAIANSRRADLFISVHANASPSRVASGVETFFVSPDRAKAGSAKSAAQEEGSRPSDAKVAGESAPQKPEPIVASVSVGNRVAESRELARYIQAGLVRGIGAHSPRTAANRGVKHAPFAVLLGAAMPSVLAEVSFMSNPRDEALLQTAQFRERIAASLYAGLNAYLKKNRPVEAKAK